MLKLIHVKTNPNLESNIFKQFFHQITILERFSLTPTSKWFWIT